MRTDSNRTDPGLPPATVTVPLARQRHPAVGRNRIYQAIASGSLSGVRVGKRLAIPVDALDEWVKAGAPISPALCRTEQVDATRPELDARRPP